MKYISRATRVRLALVLAAGLILVAPVLAQRAAKDAATPPTHAELMQAQSVDQHSLAQLKSLGLALRQYTQDYDEILPPMRSAQSRAEIESYKNSYYQNTAMDKVQKVLWPYVKNTDIFIHPTTGEIYRPNVNLSRRLTSDLEPAGQVIAFYEASPGFDGRRGVVYLDAHAAREVESVWDSIRARSDTIAPPFKIGKRISNGNSTKTTVTLYDSAAMTYMYRRQRDNKGRSQTVYLSNATGQIYYRDPETHQAIFLSSPDGKTALGGITIPADQAQEFRDFQGYNGQTEGGSFVGNDINPMIVTPKIKMALGVQPALKGSQINVDTMGESKTVVLRGTTTSNAQKIMAEALAKKNAPGFRIVNQLVIK